MTRDALSEEVAKKMDYLDFEIEIGIGEGRIYPVAVVRSAAGEAREAMRFPFDELALENQLLALPVPFKYNSHCPLPRVGPAPPTTPRDPAAFYFRCGL